jgi:hypothetical protein
MGSAGGVAVGLRDANDPDGNLRIVKGIVGGAALGALSYPFARLAAQDSTQCCWESQRLRP